MADPAYPHAHAMHYPGQGSSHDPNTILLDTPNPQRQDPAETFPSTRTTFSHANSNWIPQPVAGPSTYRRTPNIGSPMTESVHSRGDVSAYSSPARQKPTGRATAHGEQVMMDGMERMAVDEGDGRVGVGDPFGERSYSEVKCLGDGSFGTVWLCDWHSPVRPGVMLSAMQCGAGARPEWAGKRLVALKRMKRVWEGGWQQARNLGEIYSLSRIPSHPAIIPLYDAFISPKSRELYFVFECMEGNLYQLTKSRRGRPLASGLIASCFHQMSTGLDHVHKHGYFHRDMKPENLLVTTTGLADYLTTAALQHINATRATTSSSEDPLPRTPTDPELIRYEKDVAVIVKLADFGLARGITSKPPYTEYVSTRWYRAPEVLLRSTEYGAPVDMWALGTILAEMLNLKPLFPGVSEIDQVYRIVDTLGDPSSDYGVDERGKTIGGGNWVSGVKLAKNVGFSFPKRKPVKFRSLFHESVPQSLIDCIADLLLYNPKYRMTSAQCIEHAYFHETLPHLQRTPPLPRIPFSQGQPAPGQAPKPQLELNAPPRQVPPSHSHHETRPAFASGDMRTLPPPVGTPDHSRPIFPSHPGQDRYGGASALVNQLRELDLPTEDLHSYGHRPPPSPLQQQAQSTEQLAVPIQPTEQWDQGARRHSVAPSTQYDGSVYEGASEVSSNPSFSQFTLANSDRRQMRAETKVANFVQAQQSIQTYEDGTPRHPSHSQPADPPPIEPCPSSSTLSLAQSNASGKLSTISSGKKKKWGMSNLFGGGDKSVTSLAPVDEVGYTGSTSGLKRTQSGNNPSDRLQMSTIPSMPEDPKLAKKEAERQKREAEKSRRQALERQQKERARAVMNKRNNTIGTVKDPLEYTSSGFNATPQVAPRQSGIYPSSGGIPSQHSRESVRDMRTISGLPISQSATSMRSHDSGGKHSLHSVHSHHSRSQPQLPVSVTDSQQNLAYYNVTTGRHKARRRDEDDDHSMSSFDHNSLRSRSVLTVGTIDSDPGPRRTRMDYNDPMLAHAYAKDPLMAKRSVSSFAQKPSHLASLSNPSLESQLARDFQVHANLASGSSSSLGQFPPHLVSQGSAPTSPYGHPHGTAVSHGHGVGRSTVGPVTPDSAGMGKTVLPSIRDWEGESDINPMFRVPRAEMDPAQHGTTLPPFADIARVADSHGKPRH